jgi:hypothetical protein
VGVGLSSHGNNVRWRGCGKKVLTEYLDLERGSDRREKKIV